MADDASGPQDPTIEPPRERRAISLVWLLPIIAVAVVAALVWREYNSRGPMIEIVFPTAEGLKEGATVVRFRNVEVGRVESLDFADDLGSVVASARMSPDVGQYLDADAEFWIVTPQVTARGVTGLDTVISGAYIEGSWDDQAGPSESRFTALDNPPLTPADTPGKRVRLLATDGGTLAVGAPIFFRRVEVGRVESKRLTDDGTGVVFEAFVNAPNDTRLTEETRFWNVSGVDFSFGAEGARLRIASLASLIQGGAAFDDLSGGDAPPVDENHLFTLYPTEREALSQSIEVDPGERLLLDVYFSGSVRSLSVGAAVEYQGVRVGRVSDVAAEVDPDAGSFATRTTIALAPTLLGLDEGDAAAALEFMEMAVAGGLRAQLTSGNLLTGALIVRLVSAPDAAPAEIEARKGRPPRMPSTPSDLDEIAGSVQGVLKRVDALPIETLLAGAVTLLDNVNAVIGSEGVRAAPDQALEALTALTTLLSSDAVQNAPVEAEALIAALRETAESEDVASARRDLATLLASAASTASALEESDLAGETAAIAAALRARLEDPELAALVAELNRATSAATTLLSSPAVVAAPEELNAALAALRALLESPGVTAAPGALTETLGAARRILTEIEESDVAGELAGAVASARAVLEAPALQGLSGDAAATMASLRARVDDPAIGALIAELNRASAAAAALISDPTTAAVPGEATATLAALRALLESPGVAAAPGELTETLAAARRILEDIEREEVAAELGEVLASTRALMADPGLASLPGEASAALTALRARIEDPAIGSLLVSLDEAVGAASVLLSDPALAETPGALNEALGAVSSALAAPGLAEAPAELTATLSSARALLEDLVREGAAAELSAAIGAARGLLDDPALRRFTSEAAETAAALRGLLGAPGIESVPAETARALASAADLLDQLRADDLSGEAAATLATARTAADALRRATADTPRLINQLSATAAQVEDILVSVDVGSELNYETVTAIREIRDAARAITDLANLVERQPNALILGK